MRKGIIAVVLICCSLLAIGQQKGATGSIEGTVIDNETDQPIGYATITLLNEADSTTVTGGLTNEDGTFSIEEIPYGTYLVDVSFIGYDRQQLGPYEFNSEQSAIKTGNILLGVDENQLDAVVVEGEGAAVRYEVDKKVYDASKIKAAEGGTAKDVLQQIPSITVNSDQSVQLRGSGNVRVLINGRPSSYTMSTILEQIPQKNIKDIEIITNPSAKYDAEGEVGIINIVLKENNMQGTTGGVNANWGTENKWNLGGNLSHRVNQWNLSSSYNYNRFRDDFFRDNLRVLKESPTMEQISDENRDFVRNRHFARIGVDYYLDDANTIFTSATYNKGDGVNETDVISDNVLLSQSILNQVQEGKNDSFYDYTRLSDGDTDDEGFDINASFQHVFNENQSHNILFDANISSSQSDELNQYQINELNSLDGETISGFSDSDLRERNDENLRFTIDYTNPFDGSQKLEAGLRSTLEQSDQQFTVRYNDVIDNTNTGQFDFSQDVHAGYLTYQNSVSDALQLKGGLRAEYTDVSSVAIGGQGASYVDDYLSFFPTASASFQASKQLQLSTSYSRRISRPGDRQLNPFADRTDQNNIFIGNNELRPEFTDSYELGFNQFWEALSIDGAVYHRNVKDQIQYYTTYNEEEGVNEVSFFNLARQRVYGAEASLNVQPNNIKWYSFQVSGNYNYSNISQNNNSDVEINNTEFQLFSGNVMNNFRFQNGWNGQLNLNYQSPFASYVGELKAMYGINANVSKRVLDNKGSIYLRANDMFNTFGLNVELDNDIRTQDLTLDWPSQMAFIGFNYNFGNMKQKTRRKMERREEQNDNNQPTMGM